MNDDRLAGDRSCGAEMLDHQLPHFVVALLIGFVGPRRPVELLGVAVLDPQQHVFGGRRRSWNRGRP